MAPLKGKQTIPRLELAAAVVAAHQNKFVKEAWNIENNVKHYMWIDAKSVLEWLCSYNLKETYIHNRVKQVRELVGKEMILKYVPTGENPADLLTRQQEATKMMTEKLWSEGPEFLKKPEKD